MTAITMRAFMTALTTGELIISTKNEKDEIVQVTKSIFNEDGTLIQEVVDYATEQIAKFDRKNDARKGSSKKTPKQIENESLRKTILFMMEENKVYTSRDIIEFGVEGVTTPQKVTALMKGLVSEGLVTVEDVKAEGTKSKVKGYTIIKKETFDDEVLKNTEK